MSTADTIAVTVLLAALIVMAVLRRSEPLGALVFVGFLSGVAVSLSVMHLAH
ncbi:MAG: hypothetical protein ACRDQ5_11680 [Sciscionella sp.]